MSTYYYVVCDTCRQLCPAASRLASGGACPLSHSFAMPWFIVRHWDCQPRSLRITSEYEELVHEYDAPYANEPDPRKEKEAERGALLARAQDAEAEVRKLRVLYA